jgi:hypothetical protein
MAVAAARVLMALAQEARVAFVAWLMLRKTRPEQRPEILSAMARHATDAGNGRTEPVAAHEPAHLQAGSTHGRAPRPANAATSLSSRVRLSVMTWRTRCLREAIGGDPDDASWVHSDSKSRDLAEQLADAGALGEMLTSAFSARSGQSRLPLVVSGDGHHLRPRIRVALRP